MKWDDTKLHVILDATGFFHDGHVSDMKVTNIILYVLALAKKKCVLCLSSAICQNKYLP